MIASTGEDIFVREEEEVKLLEDCSFAMLFYLRIVRQVRYLLSSFNVTSRRKVLQSNGIVANAPSWTLRKSSSSRTST